MILICNSKNTIGSICNNSGFSGGEWNFCQFVCLAVLKQMDIVKDEGKVKLTAHGKDSLFRKADEAGI